MRALIPQVALADVLLNASQAAFESAVRAHDAECAGLAQTHQEAMAAAAASHCAEMDALRAAHVAELLRLQSDSPPPDSLPTKSSSGFHTDPPEREEQTSQVSQPYNPVSLLHLLDIPCTCGMLLCSPCYL